MTTASADPAATSATAFLRTRTAEFHAQAENSPFQRALAKRRVTREAYADHLGQMFALHVALEAILRDLGGRVPAIGSVMKEHLYQEQCLRDDLAVFGVDPESCEPSSATRSLIAEVNRVALEAPLKILGMLYVLEGANNGGKFIAVNVRKALNLTPGQGDRYLDPYGERQRELWAQFKTDLDSAVTEPDALDRLLDGAVRMYEGILAIGEEIHDAHGEPNAS
jgi:heme oxygenase